LLLLIVFFLAALDVIDKILGFTMPRRVQQIQRNAEMDVKVACCSRNISKHTPAVLAVGVLLNACAQQGLSEDYLNFVPAFLLTNEARACAEELKEFIANHVRARPTEVTTAAQATLSHGSA